MEEKRNPAGFPPPDHDHGTCVASTVARAEEALASRGQRLTPLRRGVLEEIAGSHAAVGAYEVLDRMARKSGRRLAPISVYRALESLVGVGIVHRLESRNAFFACHATHAGNRRQIVFACERCGAVAEVPGPNVFEDLASAARTVGFKPTRAMVEVMGICRPCAAAEV
jgi:Fur family transcriptional regulator, zinc uptake regulator